MLRIEFTGFSSTPSVELNEYMPGNLSLLFLLLPLLTACESIPYYSQAVRGHFALMMERRPIQQLLGDDDLDGTLKRQLLLAQSMRDFASESLKLPDNGSYRSFVPVAGEALVWSLVATEAYSIEPRQWCYPVIGCASYRGYFSLKEAQYQALKLEEEGFDVALEPVPAYSTLGWFEDPLPGTVIHWSEWQLAGLIFHELAHQRLYIPNDSAFNESFANKVQQAGVARWLSTAGDGEQFDAWELAQQRQRTVVALLLAARRELADLYASPLGQQEMEAAKTARFTQLKSDYRHLRQGWGAVGGYDDWFERKLNNARLASVATYENWVPVFDLLLARAKGDFARFYQACEKLAGMPAEQRQEEMLRLRAVADSESP